MNISGASNDGRFLTSAVIIPCVLGSALCGPLSAEKIPSMELRQLAPFLRVLCRVLCISQTEPCEFEFLCSGASSRCPTSVTSQGSNWGTAENNRRLSCPQAVLILKPQAQNVCLQPPQFHVTAQAYPMTSSPYSRVAQEAFERVCCWNHV